MGLDWIGFGVRSHFGSRQRGASSVLGHRLQACIQRARPQATSRDSFVPCAAAKRVEKEDEEEEKRQVELRRAQDQLKKCRDDEDYTGAAAEQENIAALMSGTSPLSPLSMAEEDARAEMTDRDQNILANERGAKRGRNLSGHPSADDTPPKKVNKPGDAINVTPLKEEIGAAAVREELEAQLQKRVVEKAYIGAAAVQEKLRVIAQQTTFDRVAAAKRVETRPTSPAT